MNQQQDIIESLSRVIQTLNTLQIRYHLTGGLVSSFYGEPRLTQDIDFVVVLSTKDASRLVEELKDDFMIDLQATENAISNKNIFQALHKETIIKIDFHVGEGIPGELSRSIQCELFPDVTLPIASKTDSILSKLLWVKQGSDKSRKDIISMLLHPQSIDDTLLAELAEQLQLTQILSELFQEAEKLTVKD